MRGSDTATKERIREIKFVKEDFNVEKLIRNKTTRLATTTSNYLRTTIITSRSMEIARTATTTNQKKIIETNVDEKQEEAIETNVNEKSEETIETKKENKKAKKEKKKDKNKNDKKIEKTNYREKSKKATNTEEKIKKVESKKQNKEKIEDTKKVEQKTETKSIGKIKVSISKGMDLTKRTGLSKEQFKKLIKHVSQDSSKFFYNNADTIYDLCAKYQINEIFFCGLISAESGWNIAGNHRKTHNYVSLMSGGKLIHYSSTGEGLTVAAKVLHNNYLTPKGKFYGGKTLAGVQKRYCPSLYWIELVYGRMNDIVRATKKIK